MAHLQPNYIPPTSGSRKQIRLTSIRGFMPNTVSLTGTQVKDLWQQRFQAKGPGHNYWLYTHIPFCPQICSFCQCSTSLRKSDQQVTKYLQWLEGEIDFLAETSASGLVKFQYIGGGTPNLLTESQLDRLLGKIDRHFHFAEHSRRTFEFLPSSLRPDTLPLVRAHGFNRLSCGVQSWSSDTLKAVNRARAGLDELGRTIQNAYDLGYDEFNVDLIHGIGDESRDSFLEGLLHVLATSPTTVTIHHVIPTATNPVFANVEQELAAFVTFENLERSLGPAVAQQFPDMVWVLRPNSWILVNRRFHSGPDFSLWYFSDNERIHIDMLSFGRFAHSNILGKVCYENVSQAETYDPQEASYRAFLKTPTIDAAMDLITDLVGDRESNPSPIEQRYGTEGLLPLQPVLEELREQGRIARSHDRWTTVQTDGVFIDPFLPLLNTALEGATAPWNTPTSKEADNAIQLGSGDRRLLVFIEPIHPDRRYFCEIGRLGIYYRTVNEDRENGPQDWVDELMSGFIEEARSLVDQAPQITPKSAIARLKARQSARQLPS